MTLLGIVLVIVGLLLSIPVLWVIGLVLVVLGLFFWAGPYHRRWY